MARVKRSVNAKKKRREVSSIRPPVTVVSARACTARPRSRPSIRPLIRSVTVVLRRATSARCGSSASMLLPVPRA